MDSKGQLTAIEAFAGWISHSPARYGPEAVTRVRHAVIDTIACMCLGADKPPAHAVRQAVLDWGAGQSVVVGTAHRLAAPWAALANGAAAHAMEMDDWEIPGNTHPSAVMVPALFALGEQINADGSQVLDAYIVGFEVIVRLGEAANMEHYNRGWHQTGTIAAFGAAAGCARLLHLDEDQCAATLGIVSSMIAGYQSQAGTMTKPIHAGLAAKNGILAAQLAASGASSALHALDGEAGFICIHAGKERSAFDEPLSKLGRPLGIEEYGLVTKRYPSCGYTHRAIDGILDLQRTHSIRLEEIAGITVSMPQHFTHALRYMMPNDEREALFSTPYCVAAALIGGRLDLSDFTPHAVARRSVRELVSLVDIRPYPPIDPTRNMGPADPDIITIRLRDGRSVETSVDYPIGAAARPMTSADLDAKFRECTANCLSPDRAAVALKSARKFDSLGSIRQMTSLLTGDLSTTAANAVARV